ncbi:MAG: U32 family peptidase C-terminal domain-containing protein [Bacillota bacterium]|nr:U32 family peptidase C-terminal domain-containing protein [Bacillota bacterium]
MGEMYDKDGEIVEVCKTPMQIVYTKWNGPIEKDTMIRKIRVV